MANFFVDDSLVYTYNSLLEDVNNSEAYSMLYRTDVLYDYFLNLILALVSDKPLVLIDSDIKDNELDIDVTRINQQTSADKKSFASFDEIIKKIGDSASELTIFTSGTTGQPKKVTHTITTLTRSVRISEKNADAVWGFAYNPTHMAGLQVFFQAILNQNTVVNLFNKNRQRINELIEEHGITHISATPTFYRLLLPVEKKNETVVRVTLGGEKSSSNLYVSISELFPNAKLNNIYASTEAGSLFVSRGENFQIPENIKSKIKIEDDELLIHSSLLGKSDNLVLKDDYYATGDLIEWINAESGLFRFISRKNELINVGGYKVNPHEVEDVMLTIDGVLEVVVYARENSVIGNILCADVQVSTGNELSELELKKMLQTKVQGYKIPRKIKFVENFTLTRTGKIQRKK